VYTSKNFIDIESLISNTPNTTAPLGELSTFARTFSPDLGEYQDAAYPGYTLYNFNSFSSAANAGAGGPVKLDASIVTQAAALVDFCLNKTKTTSGQIYGDQLLIALETFAATINVGSITLGPVQNYTSVNGNASLWMPTSITWNDASLTDATNTHQVWIDLAAFEAEYGDFSIVVVPPLTPLDLFFTTGQNVANLIGALTMSQTMDDIQAAKNGLPETIVRSDSYNYINPLNVNQVVPVNWPTLVYGPAGNNTDAIKDALMAYILANSTHNQAAWTTIFPDIFKRTEFIIAPFWQNYAIPASSLLNGIYRPVVQITDVPTYLEALLDSTAYPGSHISANAGVLGNPYRSLAMAIVGGPDNRNGWFKLTDVYPDYIDVATTSIDFNRMGSNTQTFATKLADLVILAETMTEFTTLPVGFMKVSRNGVLYAAMSINNIQYLVASRLSVYAKLGLSIS
jgi:hypothetical protein